MNKIYFLLVALLVSGSAFAQSGVLSPEAPNKRTFDRSEISPLISPRGEFQATHFFRDGEFLDEDFEEVNVGELPAGWTTSEVEILEQVEPNVWEPTGTYTNAFNVLTASEANAGGYWPVPGLGGNLDNKFIGSNDDAPPCNCDQVFVTLETPEMDLTGASQVALSFDIFHDQGFGGGDAFVEVSTDGGGSWTPVSDALPVDESLWQSVVIPLYAFADEPSLIVRFTWTDNGTWASGFAVDNVCVGELADYNMTANKTVFGDWFLESIEPGLYKFSMVPITQASPLSVTTVLTNNGFLDNTGVGFTVDIFENGAEVVSDETSETIDQVSLDKDTLSVSDIYTPSEVGTISAEVTVFSDNDEANPADNVATTSMEITEHIYARDNGSTEAFVYPAGETSYFFGNLFDIHADQEAYAIKYAVGAGTEVEQGTVRGVIYELEEFDADGLPVLSDEIATTEETLLSEDDLNAVGDANFLNLPLTQTAPLLAGSTYMIGIEATGEVRTPVSGSQEWPAAWLQDSQGWGWTLSIPMVRLSFNPADGSVSVAEVADDGTFAISQNIPNPFSDLTRVDYTLNVPASVSYKVHDITGKLVAQEKLGQQEAGSHSFTLKGADLKAGIYQYTITANGRSLTKKMVVK